jgi:hypothetical protein
MLNDALGTAHHLLRGAARERQEKDAARIGAIDHELGDPVRERCCLARARTRDHEEWRVTGVLYCCELLGVEKGHLVI